MNLAKDNLITFKEDMTKKAVFKKSDRNIKVLVLVKFILTNLFCYFFKIKGWFFDG